MMNRKLILLVVLAVAVVGCQSRKGASTNVPLPSTPNPSPVRANYYVKRIADGDTITLVDGRGVESRIRFACIDAPEVPHSKQERESYNRADLDQFKWGKQSRNRLTQLIEQGGNRVSLNVVDSDRYRRKVAEVRLPNGTLVQQVLISEGLAVVYSEYLKNCPDATVVRQAEAQAKQQKVGIWGDPQFIPPAQWRQRYKR